MASIPCAAYKASSIHGNMRRQSRQRHSSTSSTSSVDSVECDLHSANPPTSAGSGGMLQLLRRSSGWNTAAADVTDTTDKSRTQSMSDMRLVQGAPEGILHNMRRMLMIVAVGPALIETPTVVPAAKP